MIDFWITLVISLFVAAVTIDVIVCCLEIKEKKRIKKWLEDIEKNLKKREREEQR